MQFLKWSQFLMQRISSLKHDILCFPIMSTLKVTWPEVPSISDYLGFNVMHIAMRDGNVINLKIYASRKNKPFIEYHGVENLWYAQ